MKRLFQSCFSIVPFFPFDANLLCQSSRLLLKPHSTGQLTANPARKQSVRDHGSSQSSSFGSGTIRFPLREKALSPLYTGWDGCKASSENLRFVLYSIPTIRNLPR